MNGVYLDHKIGSDSMHIWLLGGEHEVDLTAVGSAGGVHAF